MVKKASYWLHNGNLEIWIIKYPYNNFTPGDPSPLLKCSKIQLITQPKEEERIL
jgi:hypothetical protein